MKQLKQLKKIETSLYDLHKEFNSQLEILGKDAKGFHNVLIDLTAKYPDHRELIQFIVFINDKLETNQTLFSDIVADSFNEMIRVKKDLVTKLIDDDEEFHSNNNKHEETLLNSVISKVKTFKDIKILSIAIAAIVIVLGSIYAPSAIIVVLTTLAKLFT